MHSEWKNGAMGVRVNHVNGGWSNFPDRVRKHARYIVKNPGVMSRAAGNYIRMALGQRRLRSVEFAVSFDCFAKCAHCSISRLAEHHPKRPLMTVEGMRDAVAQCLDLGALNINITGGEALLAPFLPDIISACRPKRTVVSVATNGVPVTPETARNLAKWGVSIVTMSIDSAIPERHDASRGVPGCFGKLMNAIDLLQKNDIEVFLCTILTNENMRDGDIYRMVGIASEKKVMLTVNPPCEVGEWDNDNVRLKEEGRRFHRSLLKHANVRWEGSSNYFREGCPAGVEKVYISPYGDVMPCTFAHISFGNLTERPLAVIWEEMSGRAPFNKIHDRCLAGEDPEFQRIYLDPVAKSLVHPLPVENHPAFQE